MTMKTHPILFQAEMVRALLAGTKTQTRRAVKQNLDGMRLLNRFSRGGQAVFFVPDSGTESTTPVQCAIDCPYGKPGDLLWVRETIERAKEWGGLGYPADGTWLPNTAWMWNRKTVPSIHMPRWASRITLELTDVRVQCVDEISHEDALSEGCPINCDGTPSGWYRHLWESINGGGSWAENPWVWALTFKVYHQNVDEFLKGKTA